MVSSESSKLFQPLRIGDVTLQHRIVMAPMTRMRSNESHTPSAATLEYYTQRSKVPGSLIITEGTSISEDDGLMPLVPGIYSEDQIRAWRKITNAVHGNKSFIVLQIAALGRAARKDHQNEHPVVAPSAITLSTNPNEERPHALTVDEIKAVIARFVTAAKNAVKAGFDFVEIHGAHGFLVDQFLQDVSNHRLDNYGGSIEKRSRFAIEVVKAVAEAIGESKTAIKLSPWSTHQDMGMTEPIPTFSFLISALRDQLPDLAYIHVVEADSGDLTKNEPLRKLWQPKPYFTAEGYGAESAVKAADEKGVAVVIGKWYISNPDLPDRIKNGWPLSPFDETTFYGMGLDVKGYTDYPVHETV